MSSGTTPVLGLHTYDGLDDMDFNEVNADQAQLDTLPATQCTSGTRPTGGALYTGRLIYETDTKRVLMWDGTAWKVIKGQYQNWAHNWSTGGVALAIGNGTIEANYRQEGDHVDFNFIMTRGTTTNVGTAFYTWDVPNNGTMANFLDTPGQGLISAGGNLVPVYIIPINSTLMVLQRVSDGVRIANNTYVWAAGDQIRFRGSLKLNAASSN